jgi:hypothetical protein
MKRAVVACALFLASAAHAQVLGPPPTSYTSASATGTTGATTATVTPGNGQTFFLCGFSIRASANAVATGNATVTGLAGGTLNFTQSTGVNSTGVGISPVEPPLGDCIAGSAPGQAVAVNSAAPGTGGVVSVSMWGYFRQQ